MTVDLLFPNTEITCGRMLSNVANRGALYAIIVGTAHREMRSLTVNILYGIPSEHRNMPMEDALELIYRNFEQLRQGEEGDIIGESDESPYATIPKAATRHPDSVQHLINLLCDNRTLTVLQYDCVLKYLQNCREQQYKFELGDAEGVKDGSEPGTSSDAAKIERAASPQIDPEEELQRRLLEILSKPTIPNMVVDPTPPEIIAKKPKLEVKEPTLLADPSVRNALDSLFDL